MNGPLVSVIMPVFNAAKHIGESITSILSQSYLNVELIIVNDGSTDGSDGVIRSFTDERIIYRSTPNGGVAAALNTALASATGQLIARQDADDVSLPQRIQEQVALFANNPNIVIAGTWANIMDEERRPIGSHEHPTTNAAIQFQLLFDVPFVSSSVMFRASALEFAKGFDGDPRVFEDYDMWSRIARTGHCANIPEALLNYRVVGSGLSHTTTNSQERVIEQRRRNLLHWIGAEHAERPIELAAHMGFEHQLVTGRELCSLHALLSGLIDRWAADATENRTLRKILHQRMLGFHLVPHTNAFNKVLDRIRKELALLTTDHA